MKGTTNAVILQGGGGSETVFALNNTGAEITKGTKALLNSHQRTETNMADSGISATISTNNLYTTFFKQNSGYFVLNTKLCPCTYVPETDTWSYSEITYSIPVMRYVDFIDGDVSICGDRFLRGTYSTQYLQSHGNVAILNYYIGEYNGEGRCFSNPNGNIILTTYDLATDTAGTDALLNMNLIAGTSSSGGIYGRIIRLGNKVLFSQEEKNVCIIDLETNSILGTTNIDKVIAYATGLEVGDYVFCNDYHYHFTTGYTLSVYRINENYQLVNDTPAILLPWTTYNVKLYYNTSTNVLSVSTTDGVYVYKFNQKTKTFSAMPFDIDFSAISKYAGSFMKIDFSEDKTQAIMTYYDADKKVRYCFFNLSKTSNALYADPVDLYHFYPDNSVTGFATGATDATGKYEFETALAKGGE